MIQKMLQCASSAPAPQSPSVAADVMTLFEQCAWPGNFRPLGNLLKTAAAMIDVDDAIRREHLPDDFFDDLRTVAGQPPRTLETLPLHASRLEDGAASAIAAALARHGGNVSAAARALGVSRNPIYRKLPATAIPGDAVDAD